MLELCILHFTVLGLKNWVQNFWQLKEIEKYILFLTTSYICDLLK